jgi:hypothetical protein
MEEDILQAYRLGVNAYFEKPSKFADLEKFWPASSPSGPTQNVPQSAGFLVRPGALY